MIENRPETVRNPNLFSADNIPADIKNVFERLECTCTEASGEDIEIAGVKTKLTSSLFEKKEGLDISPDQMIESINASVINDSRLLWLKETEKAIAV